MEQNFNPYTDPSQMNGTPPFRRAIIKPNYFEMFSFTFAIVSIISCTVIYSAYLFGALAILFALLSRGPQMKLSSKSKASIFMGICAIVLSTVIFVVSFLFLLEQYGSLEGILRAGSDMLGIDFETEFGEFFQ